MENKFTLNEALKQRLTKKRNINLAVLILLLLFLMINLFVQNKEMRKKESIAIATFEQNNTLFDTYAQIKFQDNIFAGGVQKMIPTLEKLNCDEMIFLPEGIQLFYQGKDKYEEDFVFLRQEFKAVYISSIDEAGVRIEVQYE